MIKNRNMFLELPPLPVSDIEALRYAGVRGETEEYENLLSLCKAELLPNLRGLVTYRVVDFYADGEFCEIGGIRVKSRSLSKAFFGSKSAIIFVATVGLTADRLVKKYEGISVLRAHMINALATERIESLCDSFADMAQRELFSEYALTKRFSAGYGDLPLEFQRDIFMLLTPEKYIGVTLNDSLLMTPTKSVSALIGIKNK